MKGIKLVTSSGHHNKLYVLVPLTPLSSLPFNIYYNMISNNILLQSNITHLYQLTFCIY